MSGIRKAGDTLEGGKWAIYSLFRDNLCKRGDFGDSRIDDWFRGYCCRDNLDLNKTSRKYGVSLSPSVISNGTTFVLYFKTDQTVFGNYVLQQIRLL
jgi:hypothetical protein